MARWRDNMNILICGYGVVGKVHALYLGCEGRNIAIYDPAHDMYKERLMNPDAVIVCVSTPPREDGSCDINNVYDCICDVDDRVPILIRSTISLEGWRFLNKEFPSKSISFAPEYLRADSAMADFVNQKDIYIGNIADPDATTFWRRVFGNKFNLHWERPEELILAKYTRNSFLALKVAFFNQLYDLCQEANVSYEGVRKLVAEDDRIGDSHTFVTHERGFGGHCFPKDTSAFVSTGQKFGVDLSILNEAIAYNDKVRKV